MVSFEEGHELLEELAGVHVSTKQVERTAESLGRQIAEDERRVVKPPPAGTPKAPTMYLAMDGTGVPMRSSELHGRAGKQPDGSAKTREVKLVTVWTAERCDRRGIPMRDPGSVTYSAAIETAATPDTATTLSPFAQRPQPATHALPSLPRPRALRLLRRRRSGLQTGHRNTTQARRHALDPGRSRRHHRPALLPAQPPIR
jgi:hypothetical protein